MRQVSKQLWCKLLNTHRQHWVMCFDANYENVKSVHEVKYASNWLSATKRQYMHWNVTRTFSQRQQRQRNAKHKKCYSKTSNCNNNCIKSSKTNNMPTHSFVKSKWLYMHLLLKSNYFIGKLIINKVRW